MSWNFDTIPVTIRLCCQSHQRRVMRGLLIYKHRAELSRVWRGQQRGIPPTSLRATMQRPKGHIWEARAAVGKDAGSRVLPDGLHSPSNSERLRDRPIVAVGGKVCYIKGNGLMRSDTGKTASALCGSSHCLDSSLTGCAPGLRVKKIRCGRCSPPIFRWPSNVPRSVRVVRWRRGWGE